MAKAEALNKTSFFVAHLSGEQLEFVKDLILSGELGAAGLRICKYLQELQSRRGCYLAGNQLEFVKDPGSETIKY